MTLVGICTVTHGSARHLDGYFRALEALSEGSSSYRLVVVDCASDDGSAHEARTLARGLRFPAQVIELGENRGFAGGMNAALAALPADTEFALALNPDARPEPSAIEALVRCHREIHRPAFRVAALTGRLSRTPTNDGPLRLDACGMALRPTWRHLDRGSDEVDRGQYSRREEVFGATGAATLYYREALLDSAVDGNVFDPDFHSFREDAELCFRLRERGWRVVYEPAARFDHARVNLPSRRRQMTPAVNFHSLKNRYLLRVLHESMPTLLSTALPALAREIGIFGYALLRERSSLAAYSWVWRERRRLLARRRLLRSRQTVRAWELAGWFWRDARPLEVAD